MGTDCVSNKIERRFEFSLGNNPMMNEISSGIVSVDTNYDRVLSSAGYEIVDSVLESKISDTLIGRIEAELKRLQASGKGGIRFPHRHSPTIASIVGSNELRELVSHLCGKPAVLIRSLLFDKQAGANWLIPWHQDLTIAVAERVDTDGFGPWSKKDGIVHAHAPKEVLESILTVRIHLDDCPKENGALRVIPGTHNCGRLSKADILRIARERDEAVCELSRGGVLLMRPLLIHASLPANLPQHRRVLHLEYTNQELPGELEWIRS